MVGGCLSERKLLPVPCRDSSQGALVLGITGAFCCCASAAGPAVKIIPYGAVYYTLFPERVTWQEANDACASMPGSQLAILDTRGAIDTVYRELLSTLSPETGVTSAWIGATGNNTHYNATAQNQSGLFSQLGGMSLQQISRLQPQPVQNRTAPGPETTLVWSDGRKVDSSQLRRLIRRTEYWSAHDVIWNQQ